MEFLNAQSRSLVIVPAYNEQLNVRSVVAAIHAYAPSFDVLVVDDGSTDSTATCARDAGAQVLVHPFNLGIGGAMQSGFKYACEQGYQEAVQVDADGQHDPAEIAKLQKAMLDHEVDMAWGSRFLEQTGYKASIARAIGIRLFSTILSRISGQPVTDPTSGFRLCNRRAIELFARDYPHDYPEVEGILMLHAHRLRMREVPVKMHPRRDGRSSITSGESIYYMVRVLLAIFVGLFRRRPVVDPGVEAPVAAERGI
jgi:glycosyltransferase involved in cell wall biosynthesis